MKKVKYYVSLTLILLAIMFLFCGGCNLLVNVVLNWLGW